MKAKEFWKQVKELEKETSYKLGVYSWNPGACNHGNLYLDTATEKGARYYLPFSLTDNEDKLDYMCSYIKEFINYLEDIALEEIDCSDIEQRGQRDLDKAEIQETFEIKFLEEHPNFAEYLSVYIAE